jgi:putative N6-adenine-specific DNA methylase
VVKVRSNRSQLKAETSIQSIVHKAAAQRLCGRYKLNRLPEDGKAAEVRVYIEKDMVSLLVDLCGEPLFKRGYRSEGGAAPLRETTAASMLLLSGWKRKFPLYDPFCGSGTILIEAAMYAWDMAPGLGRRFAFEDFLIADEKIEKDIRDELRAKIDFGRLVRIAGSDEDPRSVSIAASNVERLRDIAEGRTPQKGIRLPDRPAPVELKALPMGEACAPFPDAGFLVTNPPYGKRLGDQAQSEKTYREMSGLIERFPGWKLALITDHSGFESFFGRKADSCREISNGAIPSYFFQYELK